MADMPEELIDRAAEHLKALADGTRLRMLIRLGRGECTVGQLSRELGVAQASISKHMAVLRRAGLVESRRNGTQAICSIGDSRVFDLCGLVCQSVLRHLERDTALLQRIGPLPEQQTMTPTAKGTKR